MYKYVPAVMMFGHEPWIMNSSLKNRVQITEMNYLRGNVQGVLKTVRNRKLQWLGINREWRITSNEKNKKNKNYNKEQERKIIWNNEWRNHMPLPFQMLRRSQELQPFLKVIDNYTYQIHLYRKARVLYSNSNKFHIQN